MGTVETTMFVIQKKNRDDKWEDWNALEKYEDPRAELRNIRSIIIGGIFRLVKRTTTETVIRVK